LARQGAVGPVGGQLANLPIWARLATASPYIGFVHPEPNRLLVTVQERLFGSGPRPAADSAEAATIKRWLRRCRVTHVVDYRRVATAVGVELGRWRDPALDQIVYRAVGEPASRLWSIVRVEDPFPEARVAAYARAAPDRAALRERLSR